METVKIIVYNDKVELYKDFTLSLLYYINEYYLDKASLFNDSDIYNHFSFCYNKVCDEFKEEGIDFSNSKNLKKYFYGYYYNKIYVTNTFDAKEELPLKNHEKFWKEIFTFKNLKNNTGNLLIEIYNIFDIALNDKKINDKSSKILANVNSID
jgi:hypothetical protein